MASFSKMSFFPSGYFRVFSSWLLREKRDLSRRINVMNAEIERIGFVTVAYRQAQNPDGSYYVTEERMGVSVTPKSTLEKLVQAYVANGGNPLDISPFWMPDQSTVMDMSDGGEARVGETYPFGGVVAPKSVEPNNPAQDPQGTGYQSYEGGYLNTSRYYPARLGGRVTQKDLTTAKAMRKMRDWANQSIKHKLQDIEWRIIKQMDLREQLEQERDRVLTQAFGGSSDTTPVLDAERFNPGLTVQSLVNDFYDMLFEMEGPEKVLAFRSGFKVGFLDFSFEDEPEEIPLG
jgi:hypothetical protein